MQMLLERIPTATILNFELAITVHGQIRKKAFGLNTANNTHTLKSRKNVCSSSKDCLFLFICERTRPLSVAGTGY